MTPAPHPPERRTARRCRGTDYRIASVRIRPGHSARIVDVSPAGTLIETHFRLLPGAAVELHMDIDHRHISVRGQVVRCAVVRIRPAVCYRGAIAFDRRLTLSAGGGYQVPPSGSIRVGASRERITHDTF